MNAVQPAGHCFIRIDDVGELDDGVIDALNLAIGQAIPCVVAVIPARLDERMAAVLRSVPPSTVFQHGVTHVNRSPDPYPDEFPAGLPRDQVRAALASGRAILEERIGNKVSGYVPPWNRTSQTCIDALEDIGFEVFSAHHRFRHNTQLERLDVHVDTLRSYSPPRLRQARMIVRDTLTASRLNRTTGVMYHLAGLTKPQRALVLQTIARLGALLRR